MCANLSLEFPNITVERFGKYEICGRIEMRVWQQVIGEDPWMCNSEFYKDTKHMESHHRGPRECVLP